MIVWRWVMGWGGGLALVNLAFGGRMRTIDCMTVLVTIVIWTLAGLVTGCWWWAATERTYHHYLSDTTSKEHAKH